MSVSVNMERVRAWAGEGHFAGIVLERILTDYPETGERLTTQRGPMTSAEVLLAVKDAEHVRIMLEIHGTPYVSKA